MNELDRYAVSLENMEVLRAQVEEQAREIERLRMQLVACGVVALANTPESAAKARDMHPDYMSASCGDVIRTVDIQMQLHAELAALKAQPNGVVQWPDADEIMQMAFEEGQPGDDASGYYFELEEFDLFIQRLMEEVVRLNSSPASAGDERAAFEDAVRQHHQGDMRHLEARTDSGYYVHHIQELWLIWQARAALSAKHSEQVRGEWVVSLMGPDEVVRIQRKDGKWCGVTHLSESPRDRLLYEFLRTIAAPSAGSQGGDV